MTREEHISNLETIGCDGWTVTTEAYKSLQFAIQALEQEPCDDCISRAEVMNLKTYVKGYGHIIYAFDVNKLKSVQPKPKTDVLDKIRAEIIENSIEDYKYHGCGTDELIIETSEVLNILDKYKAESEE